MTGRWLVFSFVAVGVFLTTSGLTIVNVALPFIVEDFHADLRSAQWILLGYLLATSSTLINFGRLGDLLGSIRIQTTGSLIFIAASLLCGFSSSVEMLIGFRVLQALGASMIIATGPGIITASFPAEQRGKAVGLQGIVVGVSLSLGPSLGGFLTGLFGWKSVFLFNVPVGLLGVSLAYFIWEPAVERKKVNIDVPGSILLFAAIACLVLATHRSRDFPWTSPGIATLVVLSLLLALAFIQVEKRATHPMLDLSLFSNRIFTLAQLGNYLSNMLMFSVLFLIPFYLVHIHQYSAETVGLLLIPLPLTMIVGGPVSGFLTDRLGTKWLSVIAMGLLCVGLLSLSTLDQDSSPMGIMLRLVLLGSGRAFYRAPNLTAILSVITKERFGVAGGIYATMRHLGNISGVAMLGSFFNSRLAATVVTEGPSSPGQSLAGAASVQAFHETFLLATAVAVIGTLLAMLQREVRTSPLSSEDSPAAG